ncbi:MAG: type II toxin-antitoxin system VapC family toxin [Acidobacteria bacterium]|nr:type II toxin-antitoxin system VapC family toxin [Acidobacteriota bacterium]
MKTLYLETSALLAWMLGEPAGSQVKSSVDAAQTIVTSQLTLLEAERALIRAETQRILKAGEVERIRGLLYRSKAAWVLMEVAEEVRERASRTFPNEPIRTLDAIHLASALLFMRVFPQLELLSRDARILQNAASLGIAIAQI